MQKTSASQQYWKKFLGIEMYKIDYCLKQFLYKSLGITLPKLKEQREYWLRRGEVYRDEILQSGYLDREVFFQDMIIRSIGECNVDSAFEAGCGFGWNIKRIKETWPHMRVGGLDFSPTQLQKGKEYMAGLEIVTEQGDACDMPFADNAFDLGFSLGVFMNIHPSRIHLAAAEMLRVCRRYVLHVEYDATRCTPEFRDKRAFKTNIVPHDYKQVYEALGAKTLQLQTYEDFGEAFRIHERTQVKNPLNRWEGFEGPEKYTFYLFETPQK